MVDDESDVQGTRRYCPARSSSPQTSQQGLLRKRLQHGRSSSKPPQNILYMIPLLEWTSRVSTRLQSGLQQPLLRSGLQCLPVGTRRFKHKHDHDNDGDGGDADGWFRCLAGVADWLSSSVAGWVTKRKGAPPDDQKKRCCK